MKSLRGITATIAILPAMMLAAADIASATSITGQTIQATRNLIQSGFPESTSSTTNVVVGPGLELPDYNGLLDVDLGANTITLTKSTSNVAVGCQFEFHRRRAQHQSRQHKLEQLEWLNCNLRLRHRRRGTRASDAGPVRAGARRHRFRAPAPEHGLIRAKQELKGRPFGAVFLCRSRRGWRSPARMRAIKLAVIPNQI